MSIDLPKLTPLPHREANAASRRPIPCAGLFGWRKDAIPPGANSDEATGKAAKPNYLAD